LLTDERYLKQRMPLALAEWLTEREVPVRILISDEQVADLGKTLDPWADLMPGDVVVARTRDTFALALLRAAERPGVSILTPWAAVAAVRNKPRAAEILGRERVPMPRTYIAAAPASLRHLPHDVWPLVVKPHLGDNARGVTLVHDPTGLDDLVWEDCMVLAQSFVDTGGIDLKLYAVGERVWAVRRPSPVPLAPRPALQPTPVPVTDELAAIASACRAAFGLDLCGIDILESDQGPLVIDVNDFPNYTGVADAPDAIGDYVLGRMNAGNDLPARTAVCA